jgi:hypothetical protein
VLVASVGWALRPVSLMSLHVVVSELVGEKRRAVPVHLLSVHLFDLFSNRAILGLFPGALFSIRKLLLLCWSFLSPILHLDSSIYAKNKRV